MTTTTTMRNKRRKSEKSAAWVTEKFQMRTAGGVCMATSWFLSRNPGGQDSRNEKRETAVRVMQPLKRFRSKFLAKVGDKPSTLGDRMVTE